MAHQKHQLCLVKLCVSVLLLSLFPLSQPLENYKDALSKTILYFESQRSGHLPFNQRATWRHHSGLNDGLQQGVRLYAKFLMIVNSVSCL